MKISILNNRLLFTVLMVLFSSQLCWSQSVVQLKEEAYIKGDTIRLGDLVKVEEGALSERLADIEISPAALPGNSRNFSASLVEARLKTAGVEDVSIKGSERVRATTLHRDVTKEMLAASLQDYIELEMPWDPAITEVSIPYPGNDIVVPEGDMEIRWRPNPQYRYIGPGAFRGDVVVDGEVRRSVSIRAEIESYQEIVVAATDIPRGRPIMSGDLELQLSPVSKLPKGAFSEIGDAVGMMARRTIFPGQPVTSRSVESKRLIRRNQSVPVEVSNGNIHIQHRAKAMMDGREGDIIICMNPSTKEEFQGIVRADGVVEVQQ